VPLPVASNDLRLLGASCQLLPERATSIAALRGRNTLVLGNSQTSSIAQEELLRGMWSIDFEPPLGRGAIVDQKTPGRPTPFLGEHGKPGEPTWRCGLITVLPTEGAANDARTVIISGITPTGTDAAMDYFSSATALRDRPALPGRGLCGGFRAPIRWWSSAAPRTPSCWLPSMRLRRYWLAKYTVANVFRNRILTGDPIRAASVILLCYKKWRPVRNRCGAGFSPRRTSVLPAAVPVKTGAQDESCPTL
jgi:hypothetical protein